MGYMVYVYEALYTRKIKMHAISSGMSQCRA